MAKQLLSLCSVGRITNRDGGVGALARLYLPFQGYRFESGALIGVDNTFGNIAQDDSRTFTAPVKPNVFSKNCCGTGCGDSTGL